MQIFLQWPFCPAWVIITKWASSISFIRYRNNFLMKVRSMGFEETSSVWLREGKWQLIPQTKIMLSTDVCIELVTHTTTPCLISKKSLTLHCHLLYLTIDTLWLKTSESVLISKVTRNKTAPCLLLNSSCQWQTSNCLLYGLNNWLSPYCSLGSVPFQKICSFPVSLCMHVFIQTFFMVVYLPCQLRFL